MTTTKKNVRVVLVRPRNPLNIGAAARAMLNFGFDDLVVVAPHEPVLQEAKSAMGAAEVLRAARTAPNLLSAIEDRALVIGTSSLERRSVSQPAFSLEDFSKTITKRRMKGPLALVFGSEKTGLSKEDLSHCHWIARIPTGDGCPSMNLGQAVAVCCYELSRQLGTRRSGSTSSGPAGTLGSTEPPATAGEVERLLIAIEKLLSGAAARSLTHTAGLRQTLLRSPLTGSDVKLALGILRDISLRAHQKL